MKALVTGAAGFIGSHLTDRLLADGFEVVGFDNLSTGCELFLADARRYPRFELVRGDLLDSPALARAMKDCEIVFHLAANADVRFGLQDPRRDLKQNTLGTANVLDCMRESGARRIVFASTGSVYGEPAVFPTPEDAPFPVQTSLYGASKLAAEALISAWCEGFGFQAHIFRFVSILGERYTHGHIFDFYTQLLEHPEYLNVLGDGTQRKSYLYVRDCVEAVMLAVRKAASAVNILNLGTDEYATVDDSISWIAGHLGLSPERRYSGGERGWVGDSPFIFLDCSRMRALGWAPALSIREGVVRTVEYLRQNAALLQRP